MGKRVAIVGAGSSGLTAIKCCLDEKLEPQCFERSEDIGGIWRYTEDDSDRPSVMRSTVTNTSKEVMCFSDYPFPKEYPIYMHNSYVQKYLNSYADRFNLRQYVEFNAETIQVKRSDAFRENGKWEIVIRDRQTGEKESSWFDAVMICTGRHEYQNTPYFKGLDTFEGKVLHAKAYRNLTGYEGKRVLVVGIGNSGGGIAVELGHVASKVFLSTRRGTWVFRRVVGKGIPFDMTFTRALYILKSIMPRYIVDAVFESTLTAATDHELYSLKPNHRALSQHPFVNDDLPNKIITGLVTIKPDVKAFTGTGVEFVDSTIEDNIDTVIMATGYTLEFPFLEKGLVPMKENELELFKHIFCPGLEKQTLAMIGFFQPMGSTLPLSELQCRLAARVFKGDVTLPCKEAMRRDIKRRQKFVSQQYNDSKRHAMEIEFFTYSDELTELIGCRPNLLKLLVFDTKLAFQMFFGPGPAYHYRVMGHGKWDGAKEAIQTVWERTKYPLKTSRSLLNQEMYPQPSTAVVTIKITAAVISLTILSLIIPLFIILMIMSIYFD